MNILPDPHLGVFIAAYRAPRLHTRTLLGLILVGFLSFGIPLAIGIQQGYSAYLSFGLLHIDNWSLPWFLLATILLLIWLTLILLIWLRRTRTVAIYNKGLRLAGAWRNPLHYRKTVDLPWEQFTGIAVEMVRRGLSKKIYQRATVFIKQSSPLIIKEASFLGGVENLPEFISRFKACLYPRLSPLLQAKLTDGYWLRFGPLMIHKDCLRLSNKMSNIPWIQVKRVTIQSGYLVVELNHQTAHPDHYRTPISKIPNLELLLHFIEYHTECA